MGSDSTHVFGPIVLPRSMRFSPNSKKWSRDQVCHSILLGSPRPLARTSLFFENNQFALSAVSSKEKTSRNFLAGSIEIWRKCVAGRWARALSVCWRCIRWGLTWEVHRKVMLAYDVPAIMSIPKGSALDSQKITFFGKRNPDLGRVPACCVIIVVILDIPRINVGISMGNLQIGSRKRKWTARRTRFNPPKENQNPLLCLWLKRKLNKFASCWTNLRSIPITVFYSAFW